MTFVSPDDGDAGSSLSFRCDYLNAEALGAGDVDLE